MKSASIVVALAFVAIAAIACTTTDSPPGNVPPSDAGQDVASTVDGDASSSSSSSSSGGTEKDATSNPKCFEEPSQVACVQCCSTLHEAGAITYLGASIECMCLPENCKADCESTYCGELPKDPDAQCATCIKQKETSCTNAISTACGADPDCVVFNQCLVDARCTTKAK